MKIKDLVHPDFPDVRLAYWNGFASIFDFSGRLRSKSFAFDVNSDAKALERDWQAIGNDMRKAFDRAGCK